MKTEFYEILIVGVVRNSEKSIAKEIQRLKNAFENLGEKLSFYIVESDSMDNTVDVLKQIKNSNSNFDFISLGTLEGIYPNRVKRLKFCRDYYVKEIRKRNLSNIDLVVVADLDGINSKLKSDSFKFFEEVDFEWDGLFANQKGPYYDIAALRHPFWSPNDCFQSANWWSKYDGKYHAAIREVFQRMIKLHPSSEKIRVESAFGGLALYRPWVFNKSKYSYGGGLENPEIDHVIFNKKITSLDGKLFIIPGMINGGWNNHSIGKIKILSLFRGILIRFPILKPFRKILRNLKDLWLNY